MTSSFATENELRRQMETVCRHLYDRFYLVATDGNVSVRLGQDRILTTPTGANKGFLSAKDMVVTDLQGRALSPGRAKPSSELAMHVRAYRERPDVRAVVHAHPPTATAFACAGVPLMECLMTESVVGLGGVPIAPYATPSTEEVPESIGPLVRQTDVVLMANHGVLALGTDLMTAYNKMEGVEQFAKVTLIVRQIGQAQLIPEAEVERLHALRERYGLRGAHLNCTIHGDGSRRREGGGGVDERLVESIAEEVLRGMGRG